MRFLGKILGPLLKTGLPLIVNVLKPLAKSVFYTSRINSSSGSNKCSYPQENVWVWRDSVNNF